MYVNTLYDTIWIYEAVNLTSHLYKEQYVLKK